jgi:hypothetical protein
MSLQNPDGCIYLATEGASGQRGRWDGLKTEPVE